MAEVSTPRLLPFATIEPRSDHGIGSTLFSRRSLEPVSPEPNPPFVFPMQSPMTLSGREEPSRASSASTGPPRSPRNSARTRPQRISINPLPPFQFHPSKTESPAPMGEVSPHSPTRSFPVLPRTGGHRRGGSEFIGGDGTTTGPGLMSSSPTKCEGALPSPPGAHRGPPGSKRGHAHRRSGAISSHDLSAIIRPPGEAKNSRSDSAPSTPSNPDVHLRLPSILDGLASPPLLSHHEPSPTILNRRDSAPSTGQARPRVGFSDTIEFIPRPLSTISSETSSSMSTVRASHSVTGSITSIVSGGTSSPPSAKKTEVTFRNSTNINFTDPRPKSAGAISDKFDTSRARLGRASVLDPRPGDLPFRASPSDENLTPPMSGRWLGPSRTPATNDTAEQFAASHPHEVSSFDASTQTLNDIRRIRGEQIMLDSLPVGRPRTSPEPKDVKRQRKVRSWAGSILSRKVKSRSLNDQNDNVDPVAPPQRTIALRDDFSIDDVNFDEDTTCVIRDPRYIAPRPARPDCTGLRTIAASYPQTFDLQNTVIDLDAALEPLHTPGSSDDGDSRSGSSSTKRRMHSSGSTAGFMGPGMHYHRRAESAPEMVPVDYSFFGLHRIGSNPTMADVFEEEEEEDDEDGGHEAATQALGGTTALESPPMEVLSGLGVRIIDVVDESVTPQRDVKDALGPAGSSLHMENDIEVPREYPTALRIEASRRDTVPVEIVDAVDEPRFSIVTKSSDGSTITPTLSNNLMENRAPETPTDFTFPRMTQYTDGAETVSTVSSPDFSSVSFDVARLHTANSSITDRTMWSSKKPGEIAQCSTHSTEDVPSLTSSASTMISSYPPRLSTSTEMRSSGERSMSFSAAVPRRTRPVSAGKRSSLASLSRLVGGSYGEKSKLYIESSAQSEETDKPDKKKGNRISRLMRFWKPKGKLVPP